MKIPIYRANFTPEVRRLRNSASLTQGLPEGAKL